MSKRVKWSLIAAAIVLAIVLATYGLPPHEICEATQPGHKDCASYGLPRYVLIEIARYIESHTDLIIALSGTAVAAFTGTLWWATDRLWAAGERQLEHSDRTAKRQMRAYVGVDSIDIQESSLENDGYEPINPSTPNVILRDNITIVVKNFGTTPASNVLAYIGIVPVPFAGGFPPDFDYEAVCRPRPSNNVISRLFLQGGQSAPVKFPIFDMRGFWAARRRELSITIIGRIYYADAFNEPHSTMFCLQWEPWHPYGPRFVPLDRFNGEDSKPNPQP